MLSADTRGCERVGPAGVGHGGEDPAPAVVQRGMHDVDEESEFDRGMNSV